MRQGVVRVVFVGAMVIAMVVGLGGVSESGFLDGNWQYKRAVTVYNANPFQLTQYPVSVTLDTQSLISAGKLKPDGSDLRLMHNTAEVPFAVADINTATTKVMFKADAPANGNNADYALYYGNPLASDVSVSHEKIAYEVIDEFNDGVIDPMWSFNADTVNRYEADGFLYVEKGPTGCAAEATLTGRNVSNSEILHVQFRSYSAWVGSPSYNGVHLYLYAPGSEGFMSAGASTYDKRPNNAAPNTYFNKTGASSSEISAYRCDWTQVNDRWHDYTAYWNESSNVAKITMDGVYYDEENSMGWFEDSSFKFSFGAHAFCPSGRSYAKFDYMRVWQEVSVEPTTAMGSEETTDTSPPTTAISLSGTLGNNGWYVSDVQVALSAADEEGGSGVAKTEYSFNGSDWTTYTDPFPVSAEGTTTVYYRSTDNAGNVEPTKTEAIKIDKTPPQVTINVPANTEYLLNQAVTADWSAADSLSGLASAVGTAPSGQAIETATVGMKTFSVAATDNAGNQAEQTVTYGVCYAYSGVLQPINPDGSSIFKLGSTIPVKFQLRDAGGNYVRTAIARIYVAKISDGIVGSEMEAASTSAATTGNLFRYDSTSDQYIFNLGTKPLSVGTWQIRILLDDETSKYVMISLR